MKRKTKTEPNSISAEKLIKTYYIMFAVSALLTLVMMLITNGESFSSMLFVGSYGSDNFMDFFNSIRDASSKSVYKEGIIYPPLANMLFFFLSKLISPELAASEFPYRMMLQRDVTCLFIYMFFVFLCLLLCMRIITKEFNRIEMPKVAYTLPLLLCFSFPMIYCVQRGNIAMLSLVLSMFFVFYRNSENKWLRELSFVLLAIAAGLKLYPALFGLLLLTDKKYKQAGRLILYGVICLVIPFFFYDGIESVRDIFDNLKQFSNTSIEQLSPSFVSVDILALYANLFFKLNYADMYLFLLTLTYLAAVILLFVMPEEWQKVMVIAFMIMNYTATSRSYILVLLIIPFILFLGKKKFRKRDIVYFALFSVLLLVIPTLHFFKIEAWAQYIADRFVLGSVWERKFRIFLGQPNQFISVFAVQGMMFVMFVDMLVRIYMNEILRFKPRRKKADKSEPLKTEE